MTVPTLPTGFRRLLFRLPILLFRCGLGPLLGSRFLLLNHTGRHSGLPRQTVLEVIESDQDQGVYLVASGWGVKADWFLNLLKDPDVSIEVGGRRLQVTAERLSPADSGQALARYALKYPTAARNLPRLLGIPSDGSEESFREIGEKLMPCVRFRAR